MDSSRRDLLRFASLASVAVRAAAQPAWTSAASKDRFPFLIRLCLLLPADRLLPGQIPTQFDILTDFEIPLVEDDADIARAQLGFRRVRPPGRVRVGFLHVTDGHRQVDRGRRRIVGGIDVARYQGRFRVGRRNPFQTEAGDRRAGDRSRRGICC